MAVVTQATRQKVYRVIAYNGGDVGEGGAYPGAVKSTLLQSGVSGEASTEAIDDLVASGVVEWVESEDGGKDRIRLSGEGPDPGYPSDEIDIG